MAGDAEQFSSRLNPPRVARMLLALTVERDDRAALIGDLEEEFSRLHRNSPKAAKNWYWRQTAHSAPHILWKRLQSEQARHLGLAALVMVAALVLIGYWDIWIARNAARGFYAITNPSTYTGSRIIFFLVQMLGIALIGGAIAAFVFRRHERFIKNTLMYLTPAAVILLFPTIIDLITPSEGYDKSYLLLRVLFALPALMGGGAIANWYISRR